MDKIELQWSGRTEKITAEQFGCSTGRVVMCAQINEPQLADEAYLADSSENAMAPMNQHT